MNAYEVVALVLTVLALLIFIVGSVFIYLYTPLQWWVLLIWSSVVLLICLALILLTVANANILGSLSRGWDEVKSKAAQAYAYMARQTGGAAGQPLVPAQ